MLVFVCISSLIQRLFRKALYTKPLNLFFNLLDRFSLPKIDGGQFELRLSLTMDSWLFSIFFTAILLTCLCTASACVNLALNSILTATRLFRLHDASNPKLDFRQKKSEQNGDPFNTNKLKILHTFKVRKLKIITVSNYFYSVYKKNHN